MDNIKYYNDSFAYNYDIFVSQRPKKAEILDYPEQKKVKFRAKAISKARASFMTKVAIAVLVLASVCASLFLRAEISSLKSQINSVNKEIVALESEATRLDVEIGRRISLTNLEAAATELGMQKCERNQVTYIMTNKSNTAENTDGQLTAEK